MTLDDIPSDLSIIRVEVINPEAPFGAVQIFGATNETVQVVFDSGSPVQSVFGRRGDVVAMCSDYADCYADAGSGLPPGGIEGDVLTKQGDAANDVAWAPAEAGGVTDPLYIGDNARISSTPTGMMIEYLDGSGWHIAQTWP